MSFRSCNQEHRLEGAVLAMANMLFSDGVPPFKNYCRETGVAPTTYQRMARWLLGVLANLLEQRRPGPKPAERTDESRQAREAALRELEDLRAWLRTKHTTTEKNTCYTADATERIARVSEAIHGTGVLDYAEIARFLGIHERHLFRIRQEVKEAGGRAPEPKSRRPHRVRTLPVALQDLIRKIAISKHHYTPTDVKRILDKNYAQELQRHLGTTTIALTTVSKYMPNEAPTKQPRVHPRGGYDYPEPFQQVAIDTTHFKLFGWKFYFVTVFEMSGRLHLLTKVFLRENTSAIAEVIEQCLSQYPGIAAFVIDRGSPYVNAEIRRLLEERGVLRIVAPTATPTAKAALERHFRTLKEVLGRAVEAVFAKGNPGWGRAYVAQILEVAIAVFREMYHAIPQESIDGKSPAERIVEFDPVRGAAEIVRLFERSVESEPSAEYARHIHRRFQLSNPESDTVKRLQRFSTVDLRALEDTVAPFMGPPFPAWMYDPLGYLEARARKIWEARERRIHLARYDQERAQQQREQNKADRRKRAEEEHARRQSPERFVDTTLRSLAKAINIGINPLVRIFVNQLKPLVRTLAQQLGHAFRQETERIRERAFAFADGEQTRRELASILERLFLELQVEGAAC